MAVPPPVEASPPEVVHPDADATPILTVAPNITVRPYLDRDAEGTAKHGNNKVIALRMRNRFPHPYTRESASWWINSCKDPATFVRPGPFDPETSEGTLPGIPTKFCVCVDDEAVGGMGLMFKDDVSCRNAEVGYWLGEEFWGQGIMGKVVPEFVAWAWRTFGRLERMEGLVFEGNEASCKLLLKSGLKSYGRREKAIWKAGKTLAIDCFEMVRED